MISAEPLDGRTSSDAARRDPVAARAPATPAASPRRRARRPRPGSRGHLPPQALAERVEQLAVDWLAGRSHDDVAVLAVQAPPRRGRHPADRHARDRHPPERPPAARHLHAVTEEEG